MLNDGGGLYFRRQQGQKQASWVFRYRAARRTRWLTIGNYPDIGLADARKRARASRVDLDDGKDPIQKLRAEREAVRQRGSFAELAEEWFAAEVKDRVKHPEIARRLIDKRLVPSLGSMMADEVTPADILRLLERVRRATPTVANDLLRVFRRIFSFGVRRGIVVSNPADGLTAKRDGGGEERARERALRRDELGSLFEAIRQGPEFGVINALVVRLLLALCVRKSELLAARWHEFDIIGETGQGAVWRLPGGRTKTAAPLDIPLPPPVVVWLKEARVIAGRSEFVFPRRRSHPRQRAGHMSLDTLNAALKALDHGLEHFTVHDLRRTARTQLSALGVRREVAERCLGHALPGIEKIYNTHDYFEERREALTAWAALLCDIERDINDVTPIRHGVG